MPWTLDAYASLLPLLTQELAISATTVTTREIFPLLLVFVSPIFDPSCSEAVSDWSNTDYVLLP